MIQEEKAAAAAAAKQAETASSSETTEADIAMEDELKMMINQEYLEISKESEAKHKGITGLENLFKSIQKKLEILDSNFSKNIISESDYKSQKVELLKKSSEIKDAITKMRYKLISEKID